MPTQKEHDTDKCDTDRSRLLDSSKAKGIYTGGTKEKDRQRIIRGIPMAECDVAADSQKCPKHEEILRRDVVGFQKPVDHVEQGIRAGAVVERAQITVYLKLFVPMPISARIVAVRTQSRKSGEKHNDHEREEQLTMALARFCRFEHHMIRAPRQRDGNKGE